MQIRTGLAIGTGIIVGSLIGMCVSEETKINAIMKVKKKLVELLTGEKWEPKKTPIKSVYHPITYGDYNKVYKEKPSDDWKKQLLTFFSKDEAEGVLNDMRLHAEKFGNISVHDLAMIQDVPMDYTWDKYGFTAEAVNNATVKEAYTKDGCKIYTIFLTDSNEPIVL